MDYNKLPENYDSPNNYEEDRDIPKATYIPQAHISGVPIPRIRMLQNDNQIDLKIFVGQIPQEWREPEVTQYFSQFGTILESQIIFNKNGNAEGCAFVKFQSMTDAQRAIEKLEKTCIGGVNVPINIKWANGEQERLGVSRESEPQLFIGSLPKECTEQNLKDIFGKFGEFTELHIMKDHDGRSKGCAFIKFQTHQSALLASRKLNAKLKLEHSDRPIEVRYAERKPEPRPPNSHGNSYIQPVVIPHIVTPTPPNILQFFVYYDEDLTPIYENWLDHQRSQNIPPPGSLLYYPDGRTETVPTSQIAPQPAPPGANLFIFHLPNSYTSDNLLKLFQPFGSVTSAQIMCKHDGKSKGYGFVGFENPSSAQNAINQLNGMQIDGKKLKVELKKGENEGIPKQVVGLNQVQFNPY